MSILGQEPVAWRRFAASTVATTGRSTKGAITTAALYGSVQPMDGDDLQVLPEGERTRRGRKVYTTTELRTTNVSAQTMNDQLYIDGVWWEVMHVQNQRSVIAHYKVLVLAVQETEA